MKLLDIQFAIIFHFAFPNCDVEIYDFDLQSNLLYVNSGKRMCDLNLSRLNVFVTKT